LVFSTGANGSGTVLITVVILTYNEQRHIGRAIRSLAGLDASVVIVDSFSTDDTVELARSLGAKIVQRKFLVHAEQFQWALDNVPVDTEWVMRLDADEVVSPELVGELTQRLPMLSSDVTGVNLNRRHVFLDRWIRHGGRYPLTLLRVWRKGVGRIEQRLMDEHMVLRHGRSVTFESDFSDHNLQDLGFFTEKHNKYAMREAIDRLNDELKFFSPDAAVSAGGSNAQAGRKRLLKQVIYNRLPFGFGPLTYFLWRYFAQLGFLDGREGLIYHFLQGFWYRFLVEAKILELRRAVAHLTDPTSIRIELTRLTGLPLQ
jgi:glycosyltransferase involved in cell wall biosynthesis